MKEEVKKLLHAGFMRDIKYLEWIDNIGKEVE
jgi:hypothetical protein